MISKFPNFQNIKFEDRDEVIRYTAQFHPFSDFNFWSMWSWDVLGEFKLSWLNGNMVVKFSDYITGVPFYSFLGSNKIKETTSTLLELSSSEGLSRELRLVPKFIADELSSSHSDFVIKEDPDNFDYILSLEKLAPHTGKKLSTRRRVINKFKEEHDPRVLSLDLSDQATKRDILDACKVWEVQKGVDPKSANHVFEAISRLLGAPDFTHIAAYGVYLENRLIGYSINEFLLKDFVMGHFMQADKEVFGGMYAYLMQETAPILMLGGAEFVNIEQDLGISGLQKWKQSYNPLGFLKKYIIS